MSTDLKYWESGLGFLGDASTDGKYWKDGLAYFGDPGAVVGDITGSDSDSIASGEAFETDGRVDGYIIGDASIVSAEAFETDGAIYVVIAGDASIDSAEAFETDGIVAAAIVADASIDSAEAFETDGSIIGETILGDASIPSAEAFETDGRVDGYILGDASIASGEAFETDGIVATAIYGDASIASEEAFESDGIIEAIVIGLSMQGIPSEETFGEDGIVLDSDPGLSKWQLWISGVNRIEYLRENTLDIQRQANFQSAARFHMCSGDGSYQPSVGSQVLIMWYDSRVSTWRRLFSGTIEEVRRSKHPPVPKLNAFYEVSCVDWGRTLSRRIVNRKYAATQFGSLNKIMSDISTQFLEPEGITYVPLATDITLGDIEFYMKPLNEALIELNNATGLTFQVDFDKNLSFVDQATAPPAPFDIEEDLNVKWYDLQLVRTRGLYRNRQYVKASFSQTTNTVILTYVLPLNKTIPPYDHVEYWDGQFFTDSRYTSGISRIVDIKLNGTSIAWYTLGSASVPNWKYLQIDPNALDLIWNLLEDPSGYPTTPGTELEFTVEMQNDLPGPIMVEDLAEIAARQAEEGGSGVYEAVEEVVDPADPDVLTAYAQSLLDKFKTMGCDLTGKILWYGLEPNQLVNVTLPNHGVSTAIPMVVDNISLKERHRTDLDISFTASSNSIARNALASMQRLVNRTRKSPARMEKSIIFTLAESIPGVDNPGIIAQNNVTPAYIVRRAMTLKEVAIYAKTAPTGQDAKFRINVNGVSIMESGYNLNYTAGSTSIERHVNFNGGSLTLQRDDIITIDILQTGSTIPGSDFTILVTGYV